MNYRVFIDSKCFTEVSDRKLKQVKVSNTILKTPTDIKDLNLGNRTIEGKSLKFYE